MRIAPVLVSAAALAGLLLAGSCNSSGTAAAKSRDTEREPASRTAAQPSSAGPVQRAVAQLSPTQDNQAKGTVIFSSDPKGVRVEVSLTGVAPGSHGFHVHEKGDCSAPDASSAGEHFAPFGSSHGGRLDSQRHVGDLGNVTADEQGRVNTSFVDDLIALSGPASIVGRAIIVHATPDDLHSQPGGGAGERIACGVIEPGR